MRVLFNTHAGLGNQIQQTRVYLSLVQYEAKRVDVAVFGGDCSETTALYWEALTDHYGGETFYHKDPIARLRNYDAHVSLTRLPYPHLCRNILYQGDNPRCGNEVDYYERIYSKSTLPRAELPLNWKRIRPRKRPPKYDIIICNGSRNSLQWIRKRYQRWNEVVAALAKDHSIACVGHPDEYIHPAADLTGIGLLETMDAISRCKCFASNDTGLYHFANVIGVPNIVVFTGTNIEKNYNEQFHSQAWVVESGEKCAPCQQADPSWSLTSRWASCNDWRCGDFDPEVIIDSIRERVKHG